MEEKGRNRAAGWKKGRRKGEVELESRGKRVIIRRRLIDDFRHQ